MLNLEFLSSKHNSFSLNLEFLSSSSLLLFWADTQQLIIFVEFSFSPHRWWSSLPCWVVFVAVGSHQLIFVPMNMIFSHHPCCCLCTPIQHVAVELFSSNSPRRSPQCPHHPLLHQVRHSVDCGAGTAPFLAVNSATIVVNHLAHFIKIIATGPMHAWPNPRRWSGARELASGVQSTWMPLGRRIGNSSKKDANKLFIHIYNIYFKHS